MPIQIVSLSVAKEHLRVSNSIEDSLITLFIHAAGDYIATFLNQNIPGLDDSPVNVPFAIQAACLLTVADMYENREGAGEKEIKENPAVMRLLYPYRVEIGV